MTNIVPLPPPVQSSATLEEAQERYAEIERVTDLIVAYDSELIMARIREKEAKDAFYHFNAGTRTVDSAEDLMKVMSEDRRLWAAVTECELHKENTSARLTALKGELAALVEGLPVTTFLFRKSRYEVTDRQIWISGFPNAIAAR